MFPIENSRRFANSNISKVIIHPICPVTKLFNQKIDKMGILNDHTGDGNATNEWQDSNLVELMKNRVFNTMESCTNVYKYRGVPY